MKYLIKFSLITAALIAIACSNDDGNSNTPTFQIEALLQSEVDMQILPAVGAFETAIVNLNTAVQDYASTPNTENLEAARSQWRGAALAAENIYTFNIGVVRDLFFQILVYDWPVTPVAIENNISNFQITEDFVNSLPPKSKSMAALEYLLFNTDVAETNIAFQNSEARRNYIRFSALNLVNLATRLQNIWSPSGDNYANTFVNNNDNGIGASFNLFFNGLHNIIDNGKITKVGKPAGLERSNAINPELTQAPFSDTSLDILRLNMQSISNAYFNPNGIGIDDYVMFLTQSEDLNEIAANRINAVTNAIDAITIPLDEAIVNQRTAVSNLHEQLEALRIFFAVDLRSRLSIIITSTDNDGD